MAIMRLNSSLLIPISIQRISSVEKPAQTRVLVIDDDEAMIAMLKLVLESNSFEVLEARSGTEGIETARQQNPEVIILDLMLPEMYGWQVCKSIRTFSQVPIIVLSAMSKPDIVARALDEGADDYLLKPMPSSVLIAHLKSLVRRARAEKNSLNGHPGSLNHE
jgi:two-component system KDP operon response regulator KdpE